MTLRSADEERRDDVGGAPIEVVPGPVIPRRGPRVSVPGEYLHVAQGDASIQRCNRPTEQTVADQPFTDEELGMIAG